MTERKRNLRPVREVTAPTLQFRTIHGYKRAYRIAGSGPAILLIHGIGDNSTTWNAIQAKLAQRFTVIAPDLLGHGRSDKPRADYSVAAYANGMRDLLSVLEIERVTVVGHSLGGGVANAIRLPVPASGGTADPGRRRRRHQGRQRGLAAGVAADGQRGAGLAAVAPGAAGAADGREDPWQGTGHDRPGQRPGERAADPRRPAGADGLVGVHAAPCGRWWTGAGRSSPCWIDVI